MVGERPEQKEICVLTSEKENEGYHLRGNNGKGAERKQNACKQTQKQTRTDRLTGNRNRNKAEQDAEKKEKEMKGERNLGKQEERISVEERLR